MQPPVTESHQRPQTRTKRKATISLSAIGDPAQLPSAQHTPASPGWLVVDNIHTLTHTDKFDYLLKPKRYDEARTLLFGWKEAHRAGSVAFASSGLYGAGDAFCFPARRPPASDDP